MKPVESTAEILYLRMLNRSVDKRWGDWAYEMLVAGFDSESLVMLAGEAEFYNQFEMQTMADKAFSELNLKWDNREKVSMDYVRYLVKKALAGEKQVGIVLDSLKEGYLGWDYERVLQDFALLFWAKEDLDYCGEQYYWEGATKENIDKIAIEYFREWLGKMMPN